jgi:general secretion pathway protein K
MAAVNGERGFALLVVLWTMALLALLVTHFTSAGRNAVQLAANLRANAYAQAAADGAVHEAILHLLQGAWLPDGRLRMLRVGDAAIELRIRNQAWKVNPNAAPAPVLQAMLLQLGVDGGRGAALARAIVDWRSAGPQSQSGDTKLAQYVAAGLPYAPPNKPYESLDEMGLVVGMTPPLLRRLQSVMSVYQEGDLPADGELPTAPLDGAARDGAALAPNAVWHLGATGLVMVVMIEAAASAPNGRFLRQAVVRLRAEASLDQAPYQILTWDTVGE